MIKPGSLARAKHSVVLTSLNASSVRRGNVTLGNMLSTTIALVICTQIAPSACEERSLVLTSTGILGWVYSSALRIIGCQDE